MHSTCPKFLPKHLRFVKQKSPRSCAIPMVQVGKEAKALSSNKFGSALKLIERMGLQNQSADLVLDFKVLLNFF